MDLIGPRLGFTNSFSDRDGFLHWFLFEIKIRHSLQAAKLTRFASLRILRNQCANKIQQTSSFSQFHREYVGRNTPNATHMWPVHRFLSPPSPPLTLRNDVDVRCPGTTLAGAGRCWHSNLGLCFLSPQKHQWRIIRALGLTLKCELEMRAFRWPLVLDNLTHSNPFMSQTIVICFACSNSLFALGSFVTS